jgi:ribonucleoside-diphosphate reductase alpha chain
MNTSNTVLKRLIITDTKRKTYSHEEALNSSVTYFDGDTLAASVWLNKYALKDVTGKIYESNPDEMHHRIAKEIARIETLYPNPLKAQEIYALLKDFRHIVPQGGPMAGIGNDFQVSSLSNCFVIGNEADSYGSILHIDEEQTQLMKRRGGVGHDLSHIRPKGSRVMNSALTSTGITPFMERYSNSTREVAQGGRRGALMLSISMRHPDAEDFIDAKLERGKITGANISLRLDDGFMQAALNDEKYTQQFPIDSKNPKSIKEIDAKLLWDKIIHNAWKSAEPGILFWDTIIRESIPDCYADLGYKTVTTNPCGEIPLCPYDSCRLLSLNLYGYVKDPFTKNASFDYELFQQHAWLATRIMDDIIDLEIEKIDQILLKINEDPESKEFKEIEKNLWEKIRTKCIKGRRMGIGITAEGDMLAALGLQYGSDQAISFSVGIHKTLALNVFRASVNLAKERGPFEIYDPIREEKNPFIMRLREADEELYRDMTRYGRRNIALLTIAPTGTTSLMTQTSSGIEPVFMVSYKRRKKVNPNDQGVKVNFVDEAGDSWEEYNVLHPKFITWLELKGYDIDKLRLLPESELNKIIQKSPYHKATSNDIDWIQKVKMQGAIQKWVDHSISVTVNIPNLTAKEVVGEIYKTAWESGCKGITVYRDGSRSGVLIADDNKQDVTIFKENNSPKRPNKLDAEVVRFQNNHEKWIAVVGLLGGKPYEIFTGRAEDTFVLPKDIIKGWVIKAKNDEGHNRYDFQYVDKDGYQVTYQGLSRSFNKEYWNYAKLISGVLRHGMPLPFVVDLVAALNLECEHINTWKNGVLRALKNYIPEGTKAVKGICENCGDPNGLIFKEGCLICKSCGFSECG